MRASAFEHIHDPSDPAWHGHADEAAWHARSVLRRRMLVAAGVALVLVGLALGARMALGGDDDGGSTTSRSTPVAEVAAAPPPLSQRPTTGQIEGSASAPSGSGAGGGSGWAPLEATKLPSENVSKYLQGDLSGLHPSLIRTLDELAMDLRKPVEVISGWRKHHEQQELYDMYLNGTGNLAAVPGTSKHESGRAADVYINGVALANVPGAREAARKLGLHFPVPGEAWHVEPM